MTINSVFREPLKLAHINHLPNWGFHVKTTIERSENEDIQYK